MNCYNCKDWKDDACDKTPAEMDDITCLLKHICWVLTVKFITEQDDKEEGDWWKDDNTDNNSLDKPH